ncbi:MAG TPA: amino acid ABC transporter permease [Xanthobacteraceae bacterium]|jgi:His/Glu/Gln/Arg/opine family amino acid ABC transporter permease subunit|nr:amino acid ABC transporter permease [Xanthobacteraceae bacterium]
MSRGDVVSLLQGAMVTIALSVTGILFGLVLGLSLALCRWARVPGVSQLVAAYVSVVRATPLVTLSLLIFFAIPSFGIEIDAVPAAILALTLNTAAFNCEIWRAGLIDFPATQLEATRAFGMSPFLAFRRIIFPQVWKTCLPGLVNEMTLLVKSSPAIAVVGVVDITRAAARIGAQTYEPLPPFLLATALYFIVILVFVRVQRTLEARISEEPGAA